MPRIRTQQLPQEVEEKRARNEEGEFVADDPETPEVNEAYDPPRQISGSKNVLKAETPKKVGAVEPAVKKVTSVGFGTTKVHSVYIES